MGLMVPDVVGMVNVMPSRSNLMQEGGGSVGTVVLVGGCVMLGMIGSSLGVMRE